MVTALNLQVGLTLLILGVLLTVSWLAQRYGGDRHGGGYTFLFAAWLGPAGPAFLLAYLAHRLAWRARWVLQVLGPLWLIGSVIWFLKVFG